MTEHKTMLQMGSSASALASANPTPDARQLVVETDTGMVKVGDGARSYNSLPYVAMQAPMPTGNRTTDTANLQALVTAAEATNGTIFLQAGTYAADIVTSGGLSQPRIIGKGYRITQIDGTIKFAGTPGSFSGGYLSDFGFVGTRSAGVAFLTLSGTIGVKWDRIRMSGSADVGILFLNDASHAFTETCSGQVDIEVGIKTAVEYRVSGGDASFHGCGLNDGSTINQAAGDTGPKILVGTGANPYNAPLSVLIWARTSVPLIAHQGLATANFYGNVRVESFGGTCVIGDTAQKNIILAGTLSTLGGLVKNGSLLVGQSAETNSDRTILSQGGARVSVQPGNVMRTGIEGVPEWVPPVRTNHVTDPLVADSATYWMGLNSAAVAKVTTGVLGYGSALKVSLAYGGGGDQGARYAIDAAGLTAGQKKTVAFDLYCTTGFSMWCGAWFEWTAGGHTDVGESTGDGNVTYVLPGQRVRVVRQVIVPSGHALSREGFYFKAILPSEIPVGGADVYVSNCIIEDGWTSGSLFYGGDSIGTVWAGTVNASQSTQSSTRAKATIGISADVVVPTTAAAMATISADMLAGPAVVHCVGTVANGASGALQGADISVRRDGTTLGLGDYYTLPHVAGKVPGQQFHYVFDVTETAGAHTYALWAGASTASAVVLRNVRVWVEQAI